MADKKVSGLPQTSSVMAADNLVLNQAGVTKRISVSDFYGSGIPVAVKLASGFLLGATPELVTSGAVSLAVPVTNLTLNGSQSITIPDGTQGQFKAIVATSGSGVTVLSGSLQTTVIQFTQQGDSVLLMFTGGKWNMVGGTAVGIGGGSSSPPVDLNQVYTQNSQ
jgi:hypothetical protein